GKTFMDQFNKDEYAAEREQNKYFPFANKPDWEMALYIFCLILAWPILTSTSISNCEFHKGDEDNESGLAQHFVKDYFACVCDLINGVYLQACHPY
ncbi:hypothetical protein CY34DRAFT_95542, partial [Suillus luteus UH-Slu-Lm8-n1]